MVRYTNMHCFLRLVVTYLLITSLPLLITYVSKITSSD
ncbi:hypothetical protein M23134_08278 [Microscilla marina ATCC 23134]|uniref:Uncharacterized protein n=1 Tax=Microscilla marina ATCC 23134 TaxID=313606 RepID=A1ZQF4_MICM2|nr:hypothetical protein M23134_08278 [Microscilla marina ATCC 23134]